MFKDNKDMLEGNIEILSLAWQHLSFKGLRDQFSVFEENRKKYNDYIQNNDNLLVDYYAPQVDQIILKEKVKAVARWPFESALILGFLPLILLLFTVYHIYYGCKELYTLFIDSGLADFFPFSRRSWFEYKRILSRPAKVLHKGLVFRDDKGEVKMPDREGVIADDARHKLSEGVYYNPSGFTDEQIRSSDPDVKLGYIMTETIQLSILGIAVSTRKYTRDPVWY